MAWKPLAALRLTEPGFAVGGDALIPLLGQKGGAAAGKILTLSGTVEELGASRCSRPTKPYGLGQGPGAWLLVLGGQACAQRCPVAPVLSALPARSHECQGRCAWVERGARLRAPQQASPWHGELVAPKLQLCARPAHMVGTCFPALLCHLPRPCFSPFLLGGLRQVTCPLPVRGQPCWSRGSLPGTGALVAESSTQGAGGCSGRRCGGWAKPCWARVLVSPKMLGLEGKSLRVPDGLF